LKYKPQVAAIAAGVGLMAFASPAGAFSGDEAILDGANFRLNPDTLEPGCFVGARMASTHIDLEYLAEGELAKELHISVKKDAPFSVDQVLVPSKYDGYAVYDTSFDTGHPGADPDIDPNQTAVDMFAPDLDPIDKGDVIVCVSDHGDAALNRAYVSDGLPGEVAAVDRPVIQPLVSCLGASAIEPLNTYKVGFGYDVERWYEPFAEFPFITDPQHFADHVLIKYRADQPGVRRINDMDEYGEAYSDPHSEKTNYGQPIVFHMNGDAESYLHKSLPGTVDGGTWPAPFQEAFADQTSALGLFTFTTQGDLPIRWTVKASLATEDSARYAELTDAFLRDWEARWQAYYDGTGAKPSEPLCPGTNSPAPDSRTVINLPVQTVTTPGTTQTITREITTVQTVAGATVVKQVSAKKAKSARKSCMKKAQAKKSKKAKKRAMKRCRRL
jgi:hypothetical protein